MHEPLDQNGHSSPFIDGAREARTLTRGIIAAASAEVVRLVGHKGYPVFFVALLGVRFPL